MLTWNELRYAKMEDVNDLYSIMKEIVSLKSKEAELIAKKYLTTEEIEADKEEINTELLEYLQVQYKGHKGTTLKYKNSDRKDKFRQIIITENQLQFNNCITKEAENTIKKLFNDINISDYEITDTYIKKEDDERKANLTWINTDEIISKELKSVKPEPVKPEPVKPEPVKPEPVKPEPVKPETTKPTIKPKTKKQEPPPEDYDSDIEGDIKRLEERENNDQDRNTEDDIKKWKKKINSIWNDEITEIFENIDDDTDDTYEAALSHDDYNKKANAKLIMKFDSEGISIIKLYISRTKAQTRGSKKDIGEWALRNPQSLKKVITSIVNTIKKGS
jgi:hypothetical protein